MDECVEMPQNDRGCTNIYFPAYAENSDNENLSLSKEVFSVSEEVSNRRSTKNRIRTLMIKLCHVILFLGFTSYVIISLCYDASGAVFVCVIDITWLVLLIKIVFCVDIWKPFKGLCRPCSNQRSRKIRRRGRIFITVLVCIGLLAFLVWDIWSDTEKLKPLGGFVLFVILMWIFSTNRRKVNWMTVIWGVLLQFAMGVVILRWPPGYAACKFVGDAIGHFLSYTDAGSKFVFGAKTYTMHAVAFKVLPVVVYFSAVVAVLYYLGVMQEVIRAIAAVLRLSMQTTPIESFATAAHIFIGQVPAEHVISASFMSAPAALAVSKLALPETKKTRIDMKQKMKLTTGGERNVMEAASVGATMAIKLIANVVVNLIAFIAILAFFDAALSYFGSRVGHPEVTFQYICSYVFMPVAVVMGIPWTECGLVSQLIGKKIIINEFLAFADLGSLIKEGKIQDRSMVISTYILCGFGSIAAIGINLGALSAAEPRKTRDFARLMLRAMVAGNVACFMTACVAGILYQDIPKSSRSHNQTFYETNLLNSSLFSNHSWN